MVAIEQWLVVLCCRKQQVVGTFHHDQDGDLGTEDALLDHHRLATITECRPGQHFTGGSVSLGAIVADDDTFTCSESTGLDDHLLWQCVEGSIKIFNAIDRSIGTGRDLMPVHEVLRVSLRALELGRCSAGSEAWDARFPDAIGDTCHQRSFRPDDDMVDPFIDAPLDEGSGFTDRIDVLPAWSQSCRSRISRAADDLLHSGRAG